MSESQDKIRYQAVIASPLPNKPCLGLRLQAGKLTSIDFLGPSCTPFVPEEEGAARAVSWLQHYFLHDSTAERIPFQLQGTPFQKRVWQELLRIPYGQVMCYGELAKILGSSARAVAGACRANPIPILIPCHRVVAANGPGGYMGETGGEALAIKQWLLHHEGYVG